MDIIKIIVEAIFASSLFLNALLFIPQTIKIIKTRRAEELSLITFVGFNLIQLLMLLHGYFHQELILMLGMMLSLITSITRASWVTVRHADLYAVPR